MELFKEWKMSLALGCGMYLAAYFFPEGEEV